MTLFGFGIGIFRDGRPFEQEGFVFLGHLTGAKLSLREKDQLHPVHGSKSGIFISEPAISSYGITNNSLWSNTNSNTGADWPTYPISKKQSK